MRQVNDEEDDYRTRAALHRKEKLSKGLFKLGEGETIVQNPEDSQRRGTQFTKCMDRILRSPERRSKETYRNVW